MISLKHEYIHVCDNDIESYGGNQMCMSWTTLKKCGCGVIAAADTLLYMQHWHSDFSAKELIDFGTCSAISAEKYSELVRRLNLRYFPLIPNAGSNGLMLTLGMNAFFLRNGLPFYSVWQLSDKHLWTNIEAMLRSDIPVILSVGPNFPYIWHNSKTILYVKRNESFLPASAAKAHYVTVTGIDSQWLRISSWGRMFYIKRDEFISYSRKHSLPFLCNILMIKKLSKIAGGFQT